MTKIAISPNPSGTGTFTLTAPDSNTNRTITLPDAAGVVLTDETLPVLTQAEAENPASTVMGAVSGQRLAQAFDAREKQIGVGQTWQDFTVGTQRVLTTSYQNTTGRPIMVGIAGNTGNSSNLLQVSANNSTWITIVDVNQGTQGGHASIIVPPSWYYRMSTTQGITGWRELR
jgi:hypothetical protein